MSDEENIILERDISDIPKPVTINGTKIILNQMNESICKIHCYDGSKGTGFFTKIPKNGENVPVLITNQHVLTKKSIEREKIIPYSLGNEETIKHINIGSREIFEDKDLDCTIIEIKDEDGINNFLEIVDDYSEDNKYKKESIYLLGYPNIVNDFQIFVSYGIIKNIENGIIRHISFTKNGSSGSPILSLTSFKVIGYHYGSKPNRPNEGIFIKYAIESFSKNKTKIKKEENKKEEELSEMSINFNVPKKSDKIKIFGKEFIKNNKNLKIKIEEQEKEINEFAEINESIRNKGELNVILRDINKITNMSHLFSCCRLLKEIKEIKYFDSQNITNISNIFNDCLSLESIHRDISQWDTSQITDMSFMFRNCSLLKNLPDLSEWKTCEVTNMEGIFSGCKSLIKIKGIQKWETDKVTNMKRIFSGCSSLTELPDISNWNTKKVVDMRGIFTGCLKLTTLPDISKWDTSNVKDMSEMFSICDCLSNLPDIYKWNTSEVKSMRGMFSGCKLLNSINLIYKWETKNVEDMSQMFTNCTNLKDVQDIYKWDVSKVKNMSYMFSGCKELTSLPNISEWNVKEANTYKIVDGTNIKIPLKFKGDCSIY